MDKTPVVVAVNGSPHMGAGNTGMMLAMIGAELQRLGLAWRSSIWPTTGSSTASAAGTAWNTADAGFPTTMRPSSNGCWRPTPSSSPPRSISST